MSHSLTAAEMFQDYMDGGVRRGVRRAERVAPMRVAPKRVAPNRVAPKRVAPKRVAVNPRSMASLYGGFFESLEGFADAVKDKKREMYADDKKNPMTPLAKEEVKGGAKKAKKPVKKPKKPFGKKPFGMGRYMSRGGYEEEQYQEHDEQSEEQSEEFVNIQDAVKQVKELIGGYHRAVRRAAPKRRVAPKPPTAPKRRVAPKRPATATRRFYM